MRFADGLSVEGYQLPNGEYAVSITSASEILGYAKNWLGRNIVKGGNTSKALQGHGFSGQVSEVVTPSLGGNQKSNLITLKDFNRLILFAASKGKTEAYLEEMESDMGIPMSQTQSGLPVCLQATAPQRRKPCSYTA